MGYPRALAAVGRSNAVHRLLELDRSRRHPVEDIDRRGDTPQGGLSAGAALLRRQPTEWLERMAREDGVG